MKLGVSSLVSADISEDTFKMFKDTNIRYFELAIPQYYNWDSNWIRLNSLIDLCEKYQIKIKSAQSILFNSKTTSICDDYFIPHIKYVLHVCSKIGIDVMVFGSPTSRNDVCKEKLKTIFDSIEIALQPTDQFLLIEPNCRKYGGSFFFTMSEIISFLIENGYTKIMTMIDTHNIISEGDDILEVYQKYLKYIKHIHVSENDLGAFIPSQTHLEFADLLKATDYDGLIIYEVKNSKNLINELTQFSKIYSK